LKYVAFFRNLNLGRANCPDRLGFEQAFIDAGALSAASFLTNGTMVFSTASQSQCEHVFADASAGLAHTWNMKEPGCLRSMASLEALIALDPFAGLDDDHIHEYCVSFLPPACGPLGPLPITSKRGDVRLLQRISSEVFSLSLQVGKSSGSPNAWLEKLLGAAVTTRSLNTIVRLVQKHA
jgi:uncharacterized protein (DUF1697 family)